MTECSDYEEICKFFRKCKPAKTPIESTTFLLKLMSSGQAYSISKCKTALRYFTNNLIEQLWDSNEIASIKEILQFNFPHNSIDDECIEELLKSIKTLIKKEEKTVKSVEIYLSITSNESFKEYFKRNIDKYSKVIGQSLGTLSQLPKEEANAQTLNEFTQELYYFAKNQEFRPKFLEYILKRFYEACALYEKFNNVWELTNTILFKRSLMNDEEFQENIQLFYEDIEKYDNEVMIEAFLVNFKSNMGIVARFLKHFVDNNLMERLEIDKNDFFARTEISLSLLKKHNVETSALKAVEPEIFENIVSKLTDLEIDAEELKNYLKVLTLLIGSDPHSFANSVYKIAVDNLLREKSAEDSTEFSHFFCSIMKIFGKDIYQFLKKILSALDEKLQHNLKVSKKRKRKTIDSDVTHSNKKMKMADGSSQPNDSNREIWPFAVKQLFDDVFADLNVMQTIKLWNFFSKELSTLIENLPEFISENIVFKIDFIATLFSQLFNCSRIHEHLVYKKSEISKCIEEFNEFQHRFYETIIKIEYNNQVMKAFLRMSYDYENFLMLYFYHYEENIKSDMDSVFMTNNSRIKSSEWKIIQQRIKNFGKMEEKNYSNLLMIQHLFKSNVFRISESEEDRKFLQNLLMDKEQMHVLMDNKDTRLQIFNILSVDKSMTNLVEYLYLQMSDDENKLSFALDTVKNNPKMLECFVQSVLKFMDNTNYNEILFVINELPISLLSNETKQRIVDKVVFEAGGKCLENASLNAVIEKLVKNESYKGFFKDFSLKDLLMTVSDVDKYGKLYDALFRNCFKKFTNDEAKCFEIILSENNFTLLEICAKVVSEINITHTSDSPLEKVNELKLKLIGKLLTNFQASDVALKQRLFCIFSKLCGQNMAILSEDIKSQHLNLLSKLIKSTEKSLPSDENVRLFVMTLKEARKLNLNDEIKGAIVKSLVRYLKSLIVEKIGHGVADGTEKEREIIGALNPFKNNCREQFLEFILSSASGSTALEKHQVVYIFKLCEILFEVCEKPGQKNVLATKHYMQLCDLLILQQEMNDVDLLSAVYGAHISMLKHNKENLETYAIDYAFTFYLDARNRPKSNDCKDFCRFNEAVGQLLFVAANSHQKYFRSRMPQYLRAYTKFLQEIYFYKADSNEDFNPRETSMLLRLTLQLENIIKMLMKLHCISLVIIAPYIMSSIANVFVKNPKMLTATDKFKVNIKNISYQILSTFDDRSRKHIYAASDELARDVYENLFAEMKRR